MSLASEQDLLSDASRDSVEASEAERFCVDVDGFEGPLHLLLELARKQKVDLVRISILALADQYLAFIADAREQRIDLAADYLLMASWLAYLKSRLLLPAEKGPAEEPNAEDMAGRLAFRLKRLEAMREASQRLMDGRLNGRDVFARGAPEYPVILKQPIWTTSLNDLMRAFGDVNSRRHRVKRHVVKRQPVLALDAARRRLSAMLPELSEWRDVRTLQPSREEIDAATPRSVVASFFAASLELARDHAVELRQDRVFAELYVRRARLEAADAKGVEGIR